MGKSELIRELLDRAQGLVNKADAVRKGAELANHHYNGSDRCFEVYCTGCGKHVREFHGEEIDVPLAEDAYCFSCREDQ